MHFRSLESLTSKNLDNMSASQQNLCVIPPSFTDDNESRKLHVNLPPRPPTPSNFQDPSSGYPITSPSKDPQDQNPFFFGHLTDNYVNSDYFSRRYNPENFIKEKNSPAKVQQDDSGKIYFIFATLYKLFSLRYFQVVNKKKFTNISTLRWKMKKTSNWKRAIHLRTAKTQNKIRSRGPNLQKWA